MFPGGGEERKFFDHYFIYITLKKWGFSNSIKSKSSVFQHFFLKSFFSSHHNFVIFFDD